MVSGDRPKARTIEEKAIRCQTDGSKSGQAGFVTPTLTIVKVSRVEEVLL